MVVICWLISASCFICSNNFFCFSISSNAFSIISLESCRFLLTESMLTLITLSSDVFKFSLFRLAFMSFKFTPKNDEITDISTSNIAVFNLSPPQYVSYYFTGLVLFFQNIYNISYFRVIIFPRLISKRCTTIIYIPRTKCFQYFFTRCFCSICIQKEFTKRNSVYPI